MCIMSVARHRWLTPAVPIGRRCQCQFVNVTAMISLDTGPDPYAVDTRYMAGDYLKGELRL